MNNNKEYVLTEPQIKDVSIIFRSRSDKTCIDIEIWNKNNKLFFVDGYDMTKEKVSKRISRMSVEEFSSRIESINISAWKLHYERDRYIVNGASWIVRYKDSNRKRTKVVEGYALYPDNWNDFISLLNEAILT